MPRGKSSLQNAVLKFWLSAPLKEIDEMKRPLEVIYEHRLSLAASSAAAAAVARSTKETKAVLKKQGKQKPGPKKGFKKAAQPEAKDSPTFGNKPVEESAEDIAAAAAQG